MGEGLNIYKNMTFFIGQHWNKNEKQKDEQNWKKKKKDLKSL